ALGADAALVVTPPYVRPTQAGLVQHFTAVADEGALPVVMYNVPVRTGCDLLPASVTALVGHPRIVGITEAVSEQARLAEWLALRTDGFAVLCGDDASAATAMLAGAAGVISVASNLVPAAMRRLCDLARAGRHADAEEWNAALAQFHAFASIAPNPIPVKAVLSLLGIGHGLRLPLTPLDGIHQPMAARITAAAVSIEHSLRDQIAA